MSRINVENIAEMIKKSTPPVFCFLRNQPYINDKVRVRKRVATLMNYHPIDWGKNFRNKKSNLIGLVVPNMNMFFIASVINGLSSMLTDRNYHFMILISDENIGKKKY